MILYHGGCTDGFTAAWAVSKATNDQELIGVRHGEIPPDVSGEDVVIVDFAYDKATLLSMAAKANSTILLDHHKTNLEILGDLITANVPGLIVHFDMNRSGAGMAWDYFHGSKSRPALVNYVEDGDLWRFKLPHSKEISAFIHAQDYVVDDGLTQWNRLAEKLDALNGLNDAVETGRTLLKLDQKELDRHLKQAYETELAGYKVRAVNATVLSSELANEISVVDGVPRAFGIVWRMSEDGRYRYSLRTKGLPGQIDVTEVAKMFGGGGHVAAAGFTSDYLVCPAMKKEPEYVSSRSSI